MILDNSASGWNALKGWPSLRARGRLRLTTTQLANSLSVLQSLAAGSFCFMWKAREGLPSFGLIFGPSSTKQ